MTRSRITTLRAQSHQGFRLNTIKRKQYFRDKMWSLFATFTTKQQRNSLNLK